MRVLFAGTPPFAARVLTALLDAGYDVRAAYTQPDRPAGRGRRPRAGAVKSLAEIRRIAVLQPPTLRDAEVQDALRRLAPDVLVVAAYGLILPPAVLQAPTWGCINVHASLLPRWRGAAPIQRAILAGDRETGISIMQMEEGLDTGPVLARRSTPIDGHDTAGTLHDRLAALGAQTLLEVLSRLPDALAAAEPQDDAGACYAARIEKAETRLDWTLSAASVVRRIHAFSPTPGAWTEFPEVPQASAPQRDRRLRVLRAQALAEAPADARPGCVLSARRGAFDVCCGEGVVRLLEVQPAGGRPMDAAALLNAGRVHAGDVLQ